MSSIPPPPLTPENGERGLATAEPDALVAATLSSWDSFIEITSDIDLAAAPTTMVTAIQELGTWPGQERFSRLLAEARGEAPQGPSTPREFGGATTKDTLDALRRSRDQLQQWVDSDPRWQTTGLAPVATAMGPLPLLTALHGATYQQVTVLLPATEDDPGVVSPLLGTAVRALVDTAGAFGARAKATASIVAASDTVNVGSGVVAENWRTRVVAEADLETAGPRVQADALTLIRITSGNADVPALYRSGQLRVSDMTGLMRWLPVLEQVPGLPAAAALGKAAKYVSAVSSVLSKLRFGR